VAAGEYKIPAVMRQGWRQARRGNRSCWTCGLCAIQAENALGLTR
jgi:hypothetical protein